MASQQEENSIDLGEWSTKLLGKKLVPSGGTVRDSSKEVFKKNVYLEYLG